MRAVLRSGSRWADDLPPGRDREALQILDRELGVDLPQDVPDHGCFQAGSGPEGEHTVPVSRRDTFRLDGRGSEDLIERKVGTFPLHNDLEGSVEDRLGQFARRLDGFADETEVPAVTDAVVVTAHGYEMLSPGFGQAACQSAGSMSSRVSHQRASVGSRSEKSMKGW